MCSFPIIRMRVPKMNITVGAIIFPYRLPNLILMTLEGRNGRKRGMKHKEKMAKAAKPRLNLSQLVNLVNEEGVDIFGPIVRY